MCSNVCNDRLHTITKKQHKSHILRQTKNPKLFLFIFPFKTSQHKKERKKKKIIWKKNKPKWKVCPCFFVNILLGGVEIKLTKRKEENYSHLGVRGNERATNIGFFLLNDAENVWPWFTVWLFGFGGHNFLCTRQIDRTNYNQMSSHFFLFFLFPLHSSSLKMYLLW